MVEDVVLSVVKIKVEKDIIHVQDKEEKKDIQIIEYIKIKKNGECNNR